MRLRTSSLVLVLVAPAIALLGLAGPAHAAISYNWTGATNFSWGTASNWSPAGVPTTGDSVTLNPATSPTRLSITGIPAVSLQNLTVATTPGNNVSLSGTGPLSVTGAFSWSGGDINLPLTLAGTGTVATGPANPAHFGNSGDHLLTVSGTLTFLGPGAASANALSSVELMFDSNITIAPGGRIDLANGARILANRCCTSPTSTLVNQGTLRALGGTSHLDHLGLDQSGTIDIAPGATLDAVGGPMRVYGGAVTGGGTLSVPTTSGDAFDPLLPANPDNTLKLLGNLVARGRQHPGPRRLRRGLRHRRDHRGRRRTAGRCAGARCGHLRRPRRHGGRHHQPFGALEHERRGAARRRRPGRRRTGGPRLDARGQRRHPADRPGRPGAHLAAGLDAVLRRLLHQPGPGRGQRHARPPRGDPAMGHALRLRPSGPVRGVDVGPRRHGVLGRSRGVG